MSSNGFVKALESCATYVDGLRMRLVCVVAPDGRPWLREGPDASRWWWNHPGSRIDCLEYIPGGELPERLEREPDLVPLLVFAGTCISGVTWTNWWPHRLADLPLHGRLVATTWAAFHICAGGGGPVDLWAWEPGGPTTPLARWWFSDGAAARIKPGDNYQPPFSRLHLSKVSVARPRNEPQGS